VTRYRLRWFTCLQTKRLTGQHCMAPFFHPSSSIRRDLKWVSKKITRYQEDTRQETGLDKTKLTHIQTDRQAKRNRMANREMQRRQRLYIHWGLRSKRITFLKGATFRISGGSHCSTRTWPEVFCEAKNAPNLFSAGALSQTSLRDLTTLLR